MSNIPAYKFKRESSFEVRFPTVPTANTPPRAMELRQVQYEHDLLTLTFLASSHFWFDYIRTGTVVEMSYGSSTALKSWYGYVSFITRTTSTAAENIMEVHCVGTTFPLKERATRVFYDKTIPGAVQEIVEEFGFRFIGEKDSRVFEQLSIAGHSYWEWIVEQAKRIGYGIVVEGMNFVFRPLDKIISQGVSTVPTLSFTQPEIRGDGMINSRTLSFFKVSNGEYVESSQNLRTIKSVAGVDPLTGLAVFESSSPATVGDNLRANVSDVLFNEIRGDQVVHDSVSGSSASSGAASLARMNMPARVVCLGDTRIRPFHPVFITGTGVETDGYWVPSEVTHSVNRVGMYQIKMTVGVDGTGFNAVSQERPGPTSLVGVVDLKEAISNGENINALAKDSVVLSLPKPIINESVQGFNRVGARWQYSGPRRV